MSKEIIAEIKTKFHHIKALVDHVSQGKEPPREIMELALKHMPEIEKLLESL